MPSEYSQVEADISKALSSIGKQSKPDLAKSARQFGVPYDRLRLRYLGRPSRSTRKPAGKRLTDLQEKEILDQIHQLDHQSVKRIANQILEKHHSGEQPPTVGPRWCQRFIKRHRPQFEASAGDFSPATSTTRALPTTIPRLSIALPPLDSREIRKLDMTNDQLNQQEHAELASSRGEELTYALTTSTQDISDNYTLEITLSHSSLEEYAFQSDDRAGGIFSSRISVPNSPSPPQAFWVPENLLHNVKVYFEKSCRNMIFDDQGTLLAPNGSELQNGLCNEFDSYCFTATMLEAKGLHVEFRRALSKASGLVGPMLQAEHPRTLACLFEVFIHLIQVGLPDTAFSLRNFIKRMSMKVTRKGHPWAHICQLLGDLDPQSLGQALGHVWEHITDIFNSELGKCSRLAVSVRLDYIKRVITSPQEEERLLRQLLAQFGLTPFLSTPRVKLNLAHNLNRQGRHIEAEEMAREVLSLLQRLDMFAGRTVERIECLKIVSHSQFHQEKNLAAEQTMRHAIQMIKEKLGTQHSWVSEFMIVLEGWLRDWGRDEVANKIHEEIGELIDKDESDKQTEVKSFKAMTF